MRSLTLAFVIAWCVSNANAQSKDLTKDTVSIAATLIGEWHFIHVLGPDGKPTDHIDRSQGPNGESTRVQANGPDISIRADHTYEKRFTTEHGDAGRWSIGSPTELVYTMVIPMNSRQGDMIRLTEQMFSTKHWQIDGKGNYLDSSTDHLVLLTAEEMRVNQEGYVYVYRKR